MEWTGLSEGTAVTDRFAIDGAVDDCERYWRATGISRRTAAEMRRELERHLIDATADGRSVESVIGADPGTFAHDWAAAQRGDDRIPAWDEVFAPGKRRFGWIDVGILLATAAVVLVAIVAADGGGENEMDNEIWRWIWVSLAAAFGIGEMVTAGFFLLPFSAGAIVAAVLAFAGVEPAIQVIVFIVVSVLALVALMRFVQREDRQHQASVGSNRFIGQHVVVLEVIDRLSGAGRVRMETEIWRATTDGDPITEGTEVRVVDVRGARLVVEATE